MDKLIAQIVATKENIASLAPELLVALAVLAIGVVLAYSFKRLSFWFVKKLHQKRDSIFYRWIKPVQLNSLAVGLSKVTFWTTILIFIFLTAETFGVNVFDKWIAQAAGYLPNVFAGLIILVTGFIFAGFLREFLGRTLTAAGVHNVRNAVLFSYTSCVVVVILVAVRQLGIDVAFITSSILVILACVLLGASLSFGIGSAHIVANILATYYLKKTIDIGQTIAFDNVSGKVTAITPTSVILQVEDGSRLIPSKRLLESGYKVKHADR